MTSPSSVKCRSPRPTTFGVCMSLANSVILLTNAESLVERRSGRSMITMPFAKISESLSMMMRSAWMLTESFESPPPSFGLIQIFDRGSATRCDFSRTPTAGLRYSARGPMNRVPVFVTPTTFPSASKRSSPV